MKGVMHLWDGDPVSQRGEFEFISSRAPPLKPLKVKALVAQSCATLCDPTDCSPPGSSVHIEKCKERRDYDTISCGVIDDKLASLALANKDKIYARNSEILLKNRQILDDWVNATEEVYYQKPEGGTTALVYYKKDIPSYELCVKLLASKGVLFTPGECFEMEGAVRIGYAFDSKLLKQGLDLFAEFLREI